MSKHLLIIGSGSVGQRHARNFAGLGCRISCVDPREDRLAALSAETPTVRTYRDTESALLDDCHFDAAIICSPPLFHADQTVASLQHGLPVLLEKPAAPDLKGCLRIADVRQAVGLPLLLGYTWRWWPPLAKVKELLSQGGIGPVRSAHFFMSANLADWHPWEPYQDFFMARQELGGGALLDESHWIDLLLWLFGMPDVVSGKVVKLSDLEIDSDDNVDIFASYTGKMEAVIHLDIYGRPHEKFIRFIGERGSLLWTAEPNRIVMGNKPGG